MKSYFEMSDQELIEERKVIEEQYNNFKEKNLKLDMSRGKPGSEQLDLSLELLDVIKSSSNLKTEEGFDSRNYGVLDGIVEIKRIFAQILGVQDEDVFVGGNSSLNMMFDTISHFMTHGVLNHTPWIKQEKIKFLCPVPGYDRHFSILDYFGIETINISMSETGPDMDLIEKLVAQDDSIKGIWCVPKYSNPQGITYSDETVRRFAKLQPKAEDFRIFWDNAYAIHTFGDQDDSLLSLMDECKQNNNEDLPVIFGSTSKITFSGSGIAVLATSKNNLENLKKKYSIQTIGYDKINQLRHFRFFKDYDGILQHMEKHKAILRPKFNTVIKFLEDNLLEAGVASWFKPNGGYFISVDVMDHCAKRVVELCKEAGVILTPAGATYPQGVDPLDKNIRLAPTYPPKEELEVAMNLFCVCSKLAALEVLLK